MYFGYWLKEPVKPSVSVSAYDFATLVGGNAVFEVTGDLTGNAMDDTLKATYQGRAAGRYVTRDLRFLNGERDPNSPGSHGRFTAKAKLTAYFGAHTSFGTDAGMIDGSITEFKDGTKNLGFEVTLGQTAITNGGSMGVAMGTKMFNDGPATDGTWSANYYGLNADETANKRDSNLNALPSGVAGEFDVGTDYTRVIGAYATTKQ